MKRSYGLVLAGGGTKGAYEVGAWKALSELGLDITAIVGTSIGAINGALFLQNDFDKVMEIAINNDALDVLECDEVYTIYTTPDDFLKVKELSSLLSFEM